MRKIFQMKDHQHRAFTKEMINKKQKEMREKGMKTRLMRALSISLILALVVMIVPALADGAYKFRVDFWGQGFLQDDFGGYDLESELCGVENGAEVDGPYLLWVMTATKAKKADITGPWGTAEMTKFGKGVFKYVSDWYDPDTLVGNVYATYDTKNKNPQLVVSHGCRPFEEPGAWCSPGFWRNAKDGAWALTGYSKTDLFNVTVYDYWYGATFPVDPTLADVLNDAPTYSGPPLAGTSGYELNAFNATGAMLTDALPGYRFDWDVMMAGGDEACPVDHHGNFKTEE